MNKSNIKGLSAETEADSNSTAQNQHVSQPNANTNVVCQGGEKEKRDTYSTGFKRALQIIEMQLDNKVYKTKKRNPEPNTFQQAYNDGYLKALHHVKALVESRLKNLDNGKQVW